MVKYISNGGQVLPFIHVHFEEAFTYINVRIILSSYLLLEKSKHASPLFHRQHYLLLQLNTRLSRLYYTLPSDAIVAWMLNSIENPTEPKFPYQTGSNCYEHPLTLKMTHSRSPQYVSRSRLASMSCCAYSGFTCASHYFTKPIYSRSQGRRHGTPSKHRPTLHTLCSREPFEYECITTSPFSYPHHITTPLA